MEQLLALLGGAVQFAYSCWDRIVLSGYIERLQRPENLIYFFHDVVGIDRIKPAVLEQRTNAYKALGAAHHSGARHPVAGSATRCAQRGAGRAPLPALERHRRSSLRADQRGAGVAPLSPIRRFENRPVVMPAIV